MLGSLSKLRDKCCPVGKALLDSKYYPTGKVLLDFLFLYRLGPSVYSRLLSYSTNLNYKKSGGLTVFSRAYEL